MPLPPLRHDLKCVRACLLIFSSLEASVAGLVARAVCVVIFVSVNISYVECCCHHHHPRMDLLPPASVSPVRSSPRFPYLRFISRTLPPPLPAFGSSCCASVPLFRNTHKVTKCSPLCVVYLNNQLAEIKLRCGSIDAGSSGFLCTVGPCYNEVVLV